MASQVKHILLADDDYDDCLLFADALKEVAPEIKLTTAKNGQVLMELLHTIQPPYPDAIFLDVNMPRKNGLECLEEIRKTDKLRHLPIVIFSTTAQDQTVETTYKNGANYYMQKPGTFGELKTLIRKVLDKNLGENNLQPAIENYILQPDTV